MTGSSHFSFFSSPAALHRFKTGDASSFHLREPCCLVFSMKFLPAIFSALSSQLPQELSFMYLPENLGLS